VADFLVCLSGHSPVS